MRAQCSIISIISILVSWICYGATQQEELSTALTQLVDTLQEVSTELSVSPADVRTQLDALIAQFNKNEINKQKLEQYKKLLKKFTAKDAQETFEYHYWYHAAPLLLAIHNIKTNNIAQFSIQDFVRAIRAYRHFLGVWHKRQVTIPQEYKNLVENADTYLKTIRTIIKRKITPAQTRKPQRPYRPLPPLPTQKKPQPEPTSEFQKQLQERARRLRPRETAPVVAPPAPSVLEQLAGTSALERALQQQEQAPEETWEEEPAPQIPEAPPQPPLVPHPTPKIPEAPPLPPAQVPSLETIEQEHKQKEEYSELLAAKLKQRREELGEKETEEEEEPEEPWEFE